MRKKSGKYIFTAIIGLICILIIINLGKIKFMYSMLSSYKDVKNVEAGDLPNEDNLEIKENPLEKVLDNVDNESIDNNDIDGSPESNTEDDNKDIEVNKDPYIVLVSDYNNKFEAMQADYESKLNNLISAGYEEFKSGDVSTMQLANKYINEGSKLEKECDANFNAMVQEMEKELKSNGHDTSIIKDLKDYYDSFKSSKKSQLMAKARAYMN